MTEKLNVELMNEMLYDDIKKYIMEIALKKYYKCECGNMTACIHAAPFICDDCFNDEEDCEHVYCCHDIPKTKCKKCTKVICETHKTFMYTVCDIQGFCECGEDECKYLCVKCKKQ